ncbi:chromate transporter [Breznakiellaceae bacterium SP9]
MKKLIEIVLAFLKIGAVTFGGGYAMLPVLERELIKKKGWVTMEEVMDYYTIAQITPGIIAINVSTFIGFRQKGVAGAILATLCFALPGVTIITLVALFIAGFADMELVQHAFVGIRVAVGALVLDTVIKLLKGVFKDSKAVIIFALALGFSAALSASPVLIIACAGIAGFVLYRPRRKRD